MKSAWRSASPTQKFPADAREVDVRLELGAAAGRARRSAASVLAGAKPVGEGGLAAVDLRAVPPVGVVGDERRRAIRVGARIASRARDPHRVLGPRVVLLERDLPGIVRLVLAVAEPVVDLELDPGGREQVEGRRRLELLARQQLAADEAGVRLEERLRRLAGTCTERDVAAEAAAEAAHERVVQVVVGAVERARRQVALVPRDRGPVERPAARVLEVLLPQRVPEADEGGIPIGGGSRSQPKRRSSTAEQYSRSDENGEGMRRSFPFRDPTTPSSPPGAASRAPTGTNGAPGAKTIQAIARAGRRRRRRRGRSARARRCRPARAVVGSRTVESTA